MSEQDQRGQNEFSGGSRYDCIVVGAGHAGCEAALVAARAGLNVLVLTGSMDAIAWMPCNPAIGGPGKAQVVREVDALGGEMGLNAERALTQIKLLNTSKGRAVQSVRTQCDKWQYSASMKQVLENQPNLTLKQERVERLLTQSGHVAGVVTNYRVRYEADTVILTTGTYLGGVIHISDIAIPAGRAAHAEDGPAEAVAARDTRSIHRADTISQGPWLHDGNTERLDDGTQWTSNSSP